MRLLEPEAPGAAPRGWLLAAQILSLFLTGWFVWSFVSVTPSFRSSPSVAVARAVAFALLAWMWSAAMLAGVYLMFAGQFPDYRRRILRTSTAGVWFAPATILLTEHSVASAAAALILVVNTTRVLYTEWRLAPAEPDPLPAVYVADGLFQHAALPAPGFFRQLAPGLTLAFLVQAGAAAVAMHRPWLAAGCFAFAVAFLTASAMALGILPVERPRDFPHSILGGILTVFLAACLTVGGSGWGRGRGGGAAAKASGTPGQTTGRVPGFDPVPGPAKISDNDFPGVILTTKLEKGAVRIVAPVPTGTAFSAESTQPLGIPFSGEYWMFRAPFKKPPFGSFVKRASPAWIPFLTTDHAPLQMEARHRLDEPIDLGCCSRIEIGIWNADRHPGTVWLELILIDTEPVRPVSQSLGTAAVRSSPGSLPVRETLAFPVPQACALERFNEFRVVFQRARERLDKSAMIEIDRFVLVPAGPR